MKITSKQLDPHTHKGFIKLMAEHNEDLWHIFNVLEAGDHLTGTAFRRVTKDRFDAAGRTDSQRVKMHITIEVDVISYDPGDETIRVSGRSMVETAHLKPGQYHTLVIEPHRAVTIEKHEPGYGSPAGGAAKPWPRLFVQRLTDACDIATSAEVAVAVMAEGLAHLILVSDQMSLVKAKIERAIPVKSKAAFSASQRESAMHRFYNGLAQAVAQHVDFWCRQVPRRRLRRDAEQVLLRLRLVWPVEAREGR
eukprot:gnl/Ergobibamus_cyprinoides/1689.p1 GENE.gnl/Ergobibamus_cyprinoides/1689~~gnl/Ergobibamus_cyprinoides/1689.p1  ORF type:complete len:251 (+),score=54.42 gnl/Ergobibamus_cyprinoides/1689:83-835(+)